MSEMRDITRLEDALCHRLQRRHAIVTGRAATGLYLAYSAVHQLRSEKPAQQSAAAQGKIIVPAICCPSPATVCLYADLEPIFCDIDPDTFNLCPHALERLLTIHADVVAVLAVHLYGQPASMEKLSAITKQHGVALIEDVAQALGGDINGQPLGSWGDISVVSFGHTKQVDIGWGGAILTDSDELMATMRTKLATLPVRPERLDQQFEQYRRMMYLLLQRRVQDPDIDELFLLLPQNFRDMHLFRARPDNVEPILQALAHLDESVEQRRALSARYREQLVHPAVKPVELNSGASPWRHTIRVPAFAQGAVTEALRRANIDASNWYPSLHRWYALGRAQPTDQLSEAIRHEQEVVNLWVTPEVSMERIVQTCNIINDTLERAQIARAA